MNKVIKNTLVGIPVLLSVISMSCTEDILYNPPEVERSLVIYSIFEPDSVLKIFVTKTQNLVDSGIGYVSNATVAIFDEWENLCDTAVYQGEGVYASEVVLSEGKKFIIQAEAPGFIPVRASDCIPDQVEIKSATYRHPYEYDAVNDYLYGLLTLTFQDNVNWENYYEVLILHVNDYEERRFSRTRPFIINNEFVHVDSENQNNPQSILFSDKLCNGKEVVLEIKVQESFPPYIFFRNVTKTYYQYQNSLYTYLFTQPEQNDRFFTVEPVALFSNVENGFGIIAGYNQYECQSIIENNP